MEAPAEAGDYNYTAVVNVNGQNSAEAESPVTVEAEEAPASAELICRFRRRSPLRTS